MEENVEFNEKEKDKKRRLYEIIAYEEYFVDLMDKIQHTGNLRWYWSYHDKDLKEDGTPKDSHYHILIYFDNARSFSGLMKAINFYKEEKIKFWKKGDEKGRLDYRVRYLLHYKNKDKNKYEYPLENLHTNDKTIDKFFIENDTKQYNDIGLLFDYFDNACGPISFRMFLNYVYANNLWGTYQRNAMIFNRLLDEHNESIKGEFLQIFK